MSLFKLFRAVAPATRPVDRAEPDPARRRLLAGLALAAGSAAVAGLPFGGKALAAMPPEGEGDLLDRLDSLAEDADGEVELAHYTGYRHRHGRPVRRRRRRLRRRSCRDPWFRRNNPRTCGVYRRRRRRRRYDRQCYRVGSVTVCH